MLQLARHHRKAKLPTAQTNSMASMIFEPSDKENAAPTKRPLSSSKRRPAYSPGGTHMSRPPRRTAALRTLLVETPCRSSYQIQMTKHWSSPRSHRPRSASPRRTPPSIVKEATRTTHRRSPRTTDASSLNSSTSASGDGGVRINSLPRFDRIVSDCGSVKGVSSSSDSDAVSPSGPSLEVLGPLSDLEAAVAQSFDSPSPSREERRKTLHIHAPSQFTSTQQHRSPQNSPSSSETWTGDDIFLPKSDMRARREMRVGQMRVPPGPKPQQQRSPWRPPGTACPRSPMSLREDSTTRGTPRRPRFKVLAQMPPKALNDRLPVRPASDADDEDDGSVTSLCGSE